MLVISGEMFKAGKIEDNKNIIKTDKINNMIGRRKQI